MPGKAESPSVITDARSPASQEMSGRVRRYAITMAFRMACFVGIFFVHGWVRWALFAAAVFLPYIAVLFANQADQKGGGSVAIPAGAPADAKQLTVGPDDEVLSGEVVSDETGGRWEQPSRSSGQDEPEERVA